jgi:hypothetical protein
LLCPSSSQETWASLKQAPRYVGSETIDALTAREKEYEQALVSAIGGRGRGVRLPAPANADQRRIFEGLTGAVRQEGLFYSAFSVFHATRFLCPVLKLPRVGDDFLATFRRVNKNKVLDAAEVGGSIVLKPKVAGELAKRILVMAETITRWLPPEYRDFIEWLRRGDEDRRPLIHAFADYPLELLLMDDDFLGYSAEISRTPLTPGEIPLSNYDRTELTTVLPTAPDQFLLVSPFEDDVSFAELIKNRPAYVPDFPVRVIKRRGDLLDALEDKRVECLVYFGHGLWDAKTRQSALVLQDHLFTADDVAEIRRIPPVVVLVGCNTASASTVLGGFHAALFRQGAHLVVGTAFPVPRMVGLLFLQLFVNNLLSPGVTLSKGRSRQYRDLADVVSVVRRRMRLTSDVLSLMEQGRMTPNAAQGVLHACIAQMSAWSEDEAADERRQFRLLAEALQERGVLKGRDASLARAGIVPYPLFFQTLGFPWTTRSSSWA